MAAHLGLVPDHPRPAGGSRSFATIEARMAEKVALATGEYAARRALSTSDILTAALCVVLSGHTGQDEIPLALPSSPGTAFVSITVAGASFEALVTRCAQAEPVGDATAGAVVSISVVPAPLAGATGVASADDSTSAGEAVQASGAVTAGELPVAEIGFVVSTAGPGFDVTARYAPDRYAGSRVSALLRHWEHVLSAAVADPDAPVSSLSLLDDAERSALLAAGTGSALTQPWATLPELVAAQVRAAPDAVAAICAGESLTYRDLDRRAGALAGYLRGRGVGSGTVVGGVFDRGLPTLVAMLGVLRAGAAYTPIDPSFPPDRIAFVLRDTEAPIVLTRAALAGSLPALDGVDVLRVDTDAVLFDAAVPPTPDADTTLTGAAVRLMPDAGKTPNDAVVPPARDADVTLTAAAHASDAADPDAIAYVLFTSGSTGPPKGVELPHSAIVTYLTWMIDACGIGPDSRVLGACSPVFDLSVGEIFAALTTGGCVVIATGDDVIEPGALTALIAGQRVTHTFTPPTLLGLVDPAPCHDLRCVLLCGEVLPPELMARWLDAGARVLNLYGPAETAIACTVHECGPHDAGRAVPIGTPMPGRIARVLDPHGRPAPVGAVGELVIGGAGVARGYRNRPELTAQRFVPDPFGDEASYRTGDLARWNVAGELEFFGRSDTQVKINGVRIELGEIESVLASHPDVGRAVVVVGDGTARLTAHAMAAGDRRPDIAELRAFAGRSLPAYMVPVSVRWLDAFPLGATGKVDRRALSSIAPPREVPPDGSVAALVAHTLGLASVGSDDDFFALGGSSLDAARLCARVSAEHEVHLPVSQIYRTPTLSALEAWLTTTRCSAMEDPGRSAHAQMVHAAAAHSRPEAGSGSAVRTVAEAGPPPATGATPAAEVAPAGVPLTPGQANMVGVPGLVVCPLTWWIDGPLDVGALRAALGDVHRRHQALHSRYRPGSPPIGELPDDPGSPELHLCAEMPDDAAALRCLDEVVQQPLDITAGRVWRAALIPVSGRRALFGIGIHHVAFDGPSQELIVGDLIRAYPARCAGSAPIWDHPAPTLSEMAAAAVEPTADLDRQRGYWLEKLRTVRRLDLPGVDRGPLPEWGPKDGRLFDVPGGMLAAWDDDARRRGATRFGYLVAVFGRVLARISGQSDVAMMVPVARRGNAVLDRAVGCRLDAVCLRLPSASGENWLTDAMETVGGAMGAQELPFGEVVGALARVRPDIHVLFTLPTFLLQDQQSPPLALPGVRSEPVRDQWAKEVPTPLTVEVFPTSAGATVRITVRTDRIPVELADRIGAEFREIIQAGPSPAV